MDRYTIVLALSQNGTLYAGVPHREGGFDVRRYRPRGPREVREVSFTGAMTGVEACDGRTEPAEYVVSCDGRVFRIADGFPGPIVGKRMLAGSADAYHEISSPIAWIGACDVQRRWVLDALFRAYRNGARDWRSLLTEQPYEQGDEHIDDDTGSLRAGVQERHYRDYLADLARRRDEHMARLGHEVMPTHRLVSNEEMESGSAAWLAGEGMAALSVPAPRQRRHAIAASLERCWGAVRRMDREASPMAKAA